MKVVLQPAYVLHHRLYRETSLLLEVLTQDYGRISLVARGVRSGRTKLRAILQPFQPLLVSFQSQRELKNLSHAEAPRGPFLLQGDCLLSGFYLNELLIKLLQKEDPLPFVYTIYENTLLELQGSILQQKNLRIFEKNLLQELGYGVRLEEDFSTGAPVSVNHYYVYVPEHGFKLLTERTPEAYSGKTLLAIANEQFDDEEVLRDAKRLMRTIFNVLLSHEPLNSRKLFG